MKAKIFFVVMSLVASLVVNAKSRPVADYVVTEKDSISCKTLSIGASVANITLANGDKKQVNRDDVKAYSANGKRFENLPVYVDGKPNGNTSFLELVAERGNLKLFKYSYFDTKEWDASKSLNEMKKITVLTVYKDNQYYVQVNQKNAKTLLPYFNLNESEME